MAMTSNSLAIDNETHRYMEREFVSRFRGTLLKQAEDVARADGSTTIDRRHIVLAAEQIGFGLAEEQ